MAGLWAAVGRAEPAARLFGAERALRTGVAAPWFVERYEQDVAAARAARGEAAFAAAWAEGQAMTLEQAVADALGDEAD
jgi:hypothetical protein